MLRTPDPDAVLRLLLRFGAGAVLGALFLPSVYRLNFQSECGLETKLCPEPTRAVGTPEYDDIGMRAVRGGGAFGLWSA